MHVVTTRRQYKDKVYETHLLRRSYREDGKVKNETLANLSYLPGSTIELVRESLAGRRHVVAGEDFEIERALPHGHVAALWELARKLGMPALLGPPCVQRDIALGFIIARAAKPASKAGTTKWWADSTLGADLVPASTSHDDVHAAMDWLVRRQGTIEASLARHHLAEGSMMLYDASCSWMEWAPSPLGCYGCSRDHELGKTEIRYGLMTDAVGCPISIRVFSGKTADLKALVPAVAKVRERFKLEEVVIVTDQGDVTSARTEELLSIEGTGWITCLRPSEIKPLVDAGTIPPILFDDTSLAEIGHPGYTAERLVAWRDPGLAVQCARERDELLQASEAALQEVQAAVAQPRRPLRGKDKITLRVAEVVDLGTVAKYFELVITEDSLGYERKAEQIAREAALDGICVVRTSLAPERLDAGGVVYAYKGLKVVEAEMCCAGGIEGDIQPAHHYVEGKVRAHALVGMLAAYLVWHLRRAWAPLCSTDEGRPACSTAGTSAAPAPSVGVEPSSTTTADQEYLAYSVGTVLEHLAQLTRSTLVFASGVRAEKLSIPTELQRQAFALIGAPIPLMLGHV